jgi:preprotein translocase subunit SecE
MGRRQRKKSPEAKKKKKRKVSKETTAGQNRVKSISEEKPSALAVAGTKAVKSKKTVSTKKPATTASTVPAKQGSNILSKSIQFLREVKVELKKVTWPSRKQTLGSTAVVLAIVLMISLFLGVVDIGLSNLIRVVLH